MNNRISYLFIKKNSFQLFLSIYLFYNYYYILLLLSLLVFIHIFFWGGGGVFHSVLVCFNSSQHNSPIHLYWICGSRLSVVQVDCSPWV